MVKVGDIYKFKTDEDYWYVKEVTDGICRGYYFNPKKGIPFDPEGRSGFSFDVETGRECDYGDSYILDLSKKYTKRLKLKVDKDEKVSHNKTVDIWEL